MSQYSALYFNDGDLFLQVGDELLRVHSALLKSCSSKLVETLMRHRGSKREPIFVEEKPMPFKALLHIMYGHSLCSHIDPLRRSTLNIIDGLYNLAQKYQVRPRHIDGAVQELIKRDWPEEITLWDRNEAEISRLISIHDDTDDYMANQVTADETLPEPAAVVHYVRKHFQPSSEVPFFVFTALYHITRLPPTADPSDPAMDPEWTKTNGRTVNHALLTKQDYKLVLIAIDGLRTLISDIALVEFKQYAEAAPAPPGEKGLLLRWWINFGIAILLGADRRDPFQDLRELAEAIESPGSFGLGGVSGQYRQHMSSWVRKRRLELWNSLPSYFNDWQFFPA
ncbi:hypothetical protein CPB83DRAFT_860818 [Crepidotus variabilis]|uniref:BTB domain-containing protein n=1 Tax=Crepidotus variabilis TaxID=179855 RepID=A0A9P6E949_9AGAR|nr:hypothetical protein CPB83DRAFT_860818 [Crepidotus variabilis]